MLADELDYVVGVDTHRDTHALAVVAAGSGGVVVVDPCLSACPEGYRRLLELARTHAAGARAFAIEGTGSYGAGLTRFLAERGERVLEVERPSRARGRRGKSDVLDAVRAARGALGEDKPAQPRAGGQRACLQALLRTREGALRARRGALCQLRALIVSAPTELREELRDFVATVKSERESLQRVPGTGVFLNADPGMTPMALRTNFEHNHVLHQNVVVMTIMIDRVPHVPETDRLRGDPLGDPEDGIILINARLGYHDTADIPGLLRLCTIHGLLERDARLDEASYFVSRAVLVRTNARGMRRWRKQLFLVLWHNAASPIEFFRLPEDRTVTVGGQIGI